VAAQVLGLKPEQIKINTLLGGGSFGRRGNPLGDWTVELAEVAKVLRAASRVGSIRSSASQSSSALRLSVWQSRTAST
jgi:CO/xanthine dehydrogenase Mo-binding subunit